MYLLKAQKQFQDNKWIQLGIPHCCPMSNLLHILRIKECCLLYKLKYSCICVNSEVINQ